MEIFEKELGEPALRLAGQQTSELFNVVFFGSIARASSMTHRGHGEIRAPSVALVIVRPPA